jgi:hypothetical protein
MDARVRPTLVSLINDPRGRPIRVRASNGFFDVRDALLFAYGSARAVERKMTTISRDASGEGVARVRWCDDAEERGRHRKCGSRGRGRLVATASAMVRFMDLAMASDCRRVPMAHFARIFFCDEAGGGAASGS